MRLALAPEERAAFAALASDFSCNRRVLSLYARYLNEHPTLVTFDLIEELVSSCSASREEAFVALLSAAFDLDEEGREEDARIAREYISRSVVELDPAVYRNDPYFKNIRVPEKKHGVWSLCRESYAPYEGFICGGLLYGRRFVEIPPLGYFTEPFSFPAVMQNGQEWMAIKPNEIETMRAPLASARGRVLTYGLGLGYFTYMASCKEEVDSVTVVERDSAVITLFREEILPQFSHPEKIRILQADALDYAAHEGKREDYDCVFADLWHDTGDGLPLYLRLKREERTDRRIRYEYWIEDQLLSSLRALVFEGLASEQEPPLGGGRIIRSLSELERLLSDESLRALARDIRSPSEV